MKRVVITGLGMVSPLADGVDASFDKLIAGESGLNIITRFDPEEYSCKVAGEVPFGDGSNGTFNPEKYMTPKEQRRVDLFILLGMAAGIQAVEDAGIGDLSEEEKLRTGVMAGAGIGGLPGIEKAAITLHERGPRKVSPHFIPSCLINLVAGNLSIRYGFKGPNHATVTACSSASHAIGDAGRLIMFGDADIMLAGGAESAICPVGVAGFAQARALSTHFNDTPEKASRPWDKGRDGFVMGEGAGILVLEELEHAKARGAKIYCELSGYGMSGDGYHVTAPHPSGDGAYRAMEAAFRNSKLNPEDIDYVNAHGTSTPLGDEIEYGAVKRMFGDHCKNLSMSSTKSAIGHLLGAAGAVEAVFTIKAMEQGILPPTLNLEDPDDQCTEIDLVPLKARKKEIKAALSNSFGFGGTNASVIFSKYED
ncbi:MAG: beta-ketoacyl-ACP synthase II [Sphingomonadales bacterium]